MKSREYSPGVVTILIVEDTREVRDIVTSMLHELGYYVLAANNGLEALALYQKESVIINLVLTDLIMPLMGGYELFVELKKLRPVLPIIFFTGIGEILAKAIIPSDQMANLLHKPFSSGCLSSAIDSALYNPSPLSNNSTRMISRSEVF